MILPRIGLTLGDPGGIGPEIVLKLLADTRNLPPARYVVFGSRKVIRETREALSLGLDLPPEGAAGGGLHPRLSLHEVEGLPGEYEKGKPAAPNGEASFRFFEAAVREAEQGNLEALVTGPVSKRSWTLAGIRWAGHTDYLNHLFPDAVMFFWSEPLKVALFTHHLPLAAALRKVEKDALLSFILRLNRLLGDTPLSSAHLLVCGLNPHAGEEGTLGSEEEEKILPAVMAARKRRIPVSGPYPPDTVFRKALNRPQKVVVALYHDQGLIPFKLLAFDRGVNLTLGLPFIRTSPDHGTGFDIAGQGRADPTSMAEAVRLAHRLVTIRTRAGESPAE